MDYSQHTQVGVGLNADDGCNKQQTHPQASEDGDFMVGHSRIRYSAKDDHKYCRFMNVSVCLNLLLKKRAFQTPAIKEVSVQ